MQQEDRTLRRFKQFNRKRNKNMTNNEEGDTNKEKINLH
jgi:hypothetical protein